MNTPYIHGTRSITMSLLAGRTRLLVNAVATLTMLCGCLDELDPSGQWQITETQRVGDCGATEPFTSVRKLNVTQDGSGTKVIDADGSATGTFAADVQCMIADCTAAITYVISNSGIAQTNTYFLTLSGETNEITGNSGYKLTDNGAVVCQYMNPVTGSRFALP